MRDAEKRGTLGPFIALYAPYDEDLDVIFGESRYPFIHDPRMRKAFLKESGDMLEYQMLLTRRVPSIK